MTTTHATPRARRERAADIAADANHARRLGCRLATEMTRAWKGLAPAARADMLETIHEANRRAARLEQLLA